MFNDRKVIHKTIRATNCIKYFRFIFGYVKYFYICGMAKKMKTGRKKVEPSEKVILVGFYTKRKFIEALGGMDRVRDLCKGEVEGQAHDRGHW